MVVLLSRLTLEKQELLPLTKDTLLANLLRKQERLEIAILLICRWKCRVSLVVIRMTTQSLVMLVWIPFIICWRKIVLVVVQLLVLIQALLTKSRHLTPSKNSWKQTPKPWQKQTSGQISSPSINPPTSRCISTPETESLLNAKKVARSTKNSTSLPLLTHYLPPWQPLGTTYKFSAM